MRWGCTEEEKVTNLLANAGQCRKGHTGRHGCKRREEKREMIKMDGEKRQKTQKHNSVKGREK